MPDPTRSAASGRWEFCGDGQPHERHEFIRGALRCDCPGSPSATSRLASGAEVPDVPVRPTRSAAALDALLAENERLREALEEIVGIADDHPFSFTSSIIRIGHGVLYGD